MQNMKDFFNIFFDPKFGDKVEEELEKLLEEDCTCDNLIDEIADHYMALIRLLPHSYDRVSLDKSDYRKVIFDDKSYDLENTVAHSKVNKEHFMAIDALIADLVTKGNDIENCIAQIEAKLNDE